MVGFSSSRDQVYLVLINSGISLEFARKYPEYEPAQLHIRKADYDRALEHDSWIDCYQLSKISPNEVATQLSELSPPAEDYGGLRQNHFDQVIHLLNKYADLSKTDRSIINGPIA